MFEWPPRIGNVHLMVRASLGDIGRGSSSFLASLPSPPPLRLHADDRHLDHGANLLAC